MELFYIPLVLLVLTRAFGELAEQLQQPSLVGELVAGITLGAAAALADDPGIASDSFLWMIVAPEQ